MKLLDIVNGEKCKIVGNKNLEISNIQHNSKQISYGCMFVCFKGEKHNGNDYISEAISNGASVIVTDEDILVKSATVVYVKNSRKAYAKFCNNFFDKPNNKLKTVAIVGTNGKTTTSYIIKHVLNFAGYNAGVIGTLGVEFCGKHIDSDMTTPDAYSLNKYLSLMVKSGVDFAIIEVSAHSIFYNKTYPIIFDYGIFTNFSQDHLDFFESMQNYGLTKLSFFNEKNVKLAIVNSDDLLGKTILTKNLSLFENEYKSTNDNENERYNKEQFLSNFNKLSNIQTVSYGINNPSDVFAIDIKCNPDKFIVNAFDKIFTVKSSLFGLHNVYNLLSAITLFKILGINSTKICEEIAVLPEITGRFNIISYKTNKIIIDFAHTEDGLKNLLLAVKNFKANKIITIFGCGGNRDKNKRAKMGIVASKFSDFVILTNDNPRYEDENLIIEDIKKGINCKFTTINDRFEAIKYGICNLTENDILVIAGKGGETTQEIKGEKINFSDKEAVNEILRLKSEK